MDKNIGAQYYTIRDYCQTIEDFDASCKKISETGYKLVQISGTPLEAAPMREVLDKYGLKCVTTHRGFNDFVSNLDEVIEYNRILGSDLCGVGMMPLEYVENGDTLTDFIEKANEICQRLKKENMYFGYHNHALEFIKIDGKAVMERLIEETDPEFFRFILDVYWVQVGGKNPVDYIKKLGNRAMAIHFKDYTVNIENGQMPEMTHIGNGNLDWDGIIEACEISGCRWALVEQDGNWIDNDPFSALSKSYDFLTAKGLE